jgi:hypothetical protein
MKYQNKLRWLPNPACSRRRFAALYRGSIWLCAAFFQVRHNEKAAALLASSEE